MTETAKAIPQSVMFGWSQSKISEQFDGLGLSADDLAHLDKDSDAVSRLVCRGIILRSEAERGYKRIQKRLEAMLIKRKRAASTSEQAA